MRKFAALKFLLCFATIFTLNACVNVRKAEYATPLEEPADAHPSPIKFSNMKLSFPLGEDIGVFRNGCVMGYFKLLGYTKVDGNIFRGASKKLIEDSFILALEPLGYDVVDVSSKDFAEEIDDELMRTEYKISAKIIDADIDTCNDDMPTLFEHNLSQYKGKLFLKIEWAIYDNLTKQVVYKTTTEGYAHQKQSNSDGLELMMSYAFSMAAHNLGAEQHFHDLLFYGTKPPQDWKQKKKHASRARAFDPMEKVNIQNPPLHKAPLSDHIDEIQKIAVLVQAGAGHGSGFFITDQGHIITNNHVVGDARRVRIVTADQQETLIAEVLRTDKVRDVALLKLETMPNNVPITTAPIQTKWPKVSTDIYALGAPSNTRMQDTLTKGIVSAHRKDFRLLGKEMDFIQGDVQTIGGNSGGALLDTYGNIVGLCVAGLYQRMGESDSGLNLFIPIEDALKHLDIDLIQN